MYSLNIYTFKKDLFFP